MPEYTITLTNTAETRITVSAPDPDTAVERATNGELPELCGHCSGWGPNPGVTLGEEWALTAVEEDGSTLERYDDESVWGDLQRARERIRALEQKLKTQRRGQERTDTLADAAPTPGRNR